ncbi:MAG: hypothetical protein ABFS46_23265, partial [Myxococcota bacterium]
RLARWAAPSGVAFVDALPALEQQGEAVQLYWPIDRHPTAAAHAVVAEVLARQLTSAGLVP